MNVPFKLPTPKVATPVSTDDARCRLERLYRDIGISAVASALHMSSLAAIEDRERASLSSHDMPAFLRKENVAA